MGYKQAIVSFTFSGTCATFNVSAFHYVARQADVSSHISSCVDYNTTKRALTFAIEVLFTPLREVISLNFTNVMQEMLPQVGLIPVGTPNMLSSVNAATTGVPASTTHQTEHSDNSVAIGVGVGIGLGLPLVVACIAAVYVYWRRKAERYDVRL